MANLFVTPSRQSPLLVGLVIREAEPILVAQAERPAGRAALAHRSLRSLDLSGTNLCDCSPLQPSAEGGAAIWTSVAIEALVESLATSAIVDLYLHANELAGVWSEHVCGEPSFRGEYSTTAIDLLMEVSLGAGGKGNEARKLARTNHLRPADASRLQEALSANALQARTVHQRKTAAVETDGPPLSESAAGVAVSLADLHPAAVPPRETLQVEGARRQLSLQSLGRHLSGSSDNSGNTAGSRSRGCH